MSEESERDALMAWMLAASTPEQVRAAEQVARGWLQEHPGDPAVLSAERRLRSIRGAIEERSSTPRLQAEHRAAVQFWQVGHVPVLLALPPDGRTPEAAVILQHGYQQSKETRLSEMLPLAEAGLLAVAPDAPAHGARWDLGRMQRLERDRAAEMTLLAVEAGRDIAFLSGWVRQQFGIAPARLGLHGSSLGGAAVLVATPLVKPAAAVVLKAWGSLEDHLRSSQQQAMLQAAAGAAREGAEASSPCGERAEPADLPDLVRQYDPARRVAEFPPAAVLLIAGERDSVVPAASLQALYKRLQHHYTGQPERLALATYPGEHVTPPDMKQRAREWLVRHLTGA